LLDVNEKRKETTQRLKLYEHAGADGIFLPFIKNEEDIQKAVADTKLPLNVMALPGLPDTASLNRLGVKRLSMGPFLHNKTYSALRDLAKEVFELKSIKPII
jgi:2-methylisocitrate lyase-like PEP mutase family enzyme